jgi:hypothetical protein
MCPESISNGLNPNLEIASEGGSGGRPIAAASASSQNLTGEPKEIVIC